MKTVLSAVELPLLEARLCAVLDSVTWGDPRPTLFLSKDAFTVWNSMSPNGHFHGLKMKHDPELSGYSAAVMWECGLF